MTLVITSIRLRSPLLIFRFFRFTFPVIRQIYESKAKAFETSGIWTRHYTMSLWENELDLLEFSSSGAHREAMKESKKLSREIRTLQMTAQRFPDWKEAKRTLKQHGKSTP